MFLNGVLKFEMFSDEDFIIFKIGYLHLTKIIYLKHIASLVMGLHNCSKLLLNASNSYVGRTFLARTSYLH